MLFSIKPHLIFFRLWLVTLMVTGFSACSTFSVSPYFQEPDWQAEGKIALRASQLEGGKSQSLSFRWRQRHDASLIEFFSPLGLRLFLVQKMNGRVILIDNEGRTVETETIAELAYLQMGSYLPLDNFADLMFESESDSALRSLDNAGWSVERSSYTQGHLRKIVLLSSSGSQLIFLVKHFE